MFGAAGISALDIRTRLRITEAELAIVQREVVDLKAERSELETNSKQYEESWRWVWSNMGVIRRVGVAMIMLGIVFYWLVQYICTVLV